MTPIEWKIVNDSESAGGRAFEATFAVYQTKTDPPRVGVDFYLTRHIGLIAPPTPGWFVCNKYWVTERQGRSDIMVIDHTNYEYTGTEGYQLVLGTKKIHARDKAATERNIEKWFNVGYEYDTEQCYLAKSSELMAMDGWFKGIAFDPRTKEGVCIEHKMAGVPDQLLHLCNWQCPASHVGAIELGVPPIGREKALKKGLLVPLFPGQPVRMMHKYTFYNNERLSSKIGEIRSVCPETVIYNHRGKRMSRAA